MSLAAKIDAAKSEGYSVVQEGRILRDAPATTFADRAEGCVVSMIASGDRLYENDERWVHMKRRNG